MILGLDLSLNHSGAVSLDEDGVVDGYWFVSDKKSPADKSKGLGRRSPSKKKGADAEQHQLNRMAFYERWLWDVIELSGAEYAGVEGYAYNAVSNSSYQYGELGGLARRILARARCKIRVHDIAGVKMFATGKGNAIAPQMLAALAARESTQALCEEWARIERGVKGQQVSEDLAVAYWVARLVWAERELRAGRIVLSAFDEKRVRVFNRVTKTYPVNLLDREWLTL